MLLHMQLLNVGVYFMFIWGIFLIYFVRFFKIRRNNINRIQSRNRVHTIGRSLVVNLDNFFRRLTDLDGRQRAVGLFIEYIFLYIRLTLVGKIKGISLLWFDVGRVRESICTFRCLNRWSQIISVVENLIYIFFAFMRTVWCVVSIYSDTLHVL